METLSLFAISINDVRDVFGAEPELAARLRQVAAEKFPGRPHQRRRLGPLLRRDPDSEVDPNRPLQSDVDALLQGGFIPAERSWQCWELLRVWLVDLSTALRTLELDLATTEYELAAAGLPSQYSVAHLWQRDLGVPLRPAAGQIVGYAKHPHALETLQALASLDSSGWLSEVTKQLTKELLNLLAAVRVSPAELDIVVVGHPSLSP